MSAVEQAKKIMSVLTLQMQQEIKEIKQGSLENLERRSSEKLEGLKKLNELMALITSDAEKDELAPLLLRMNRVSQENGMLLKSAYTGTRAALKRVEDIRNAADDVGVYGRDGKGVKLPDSYSVSEKSV